MTTKKLSTLKFRNPIILLLSFFLVLYSCQNGEKTKESHGENNVLATLPLTLLNKEGTDSLISNYDADTGNINNSFLYSGATDSTRKVLSFRMNAQQRNRFFQTLKNLEDGQNSEIDSVRLCVQMGFWDEQQNIIGDTSTNYVPILRFVVNSNTMIYPSFPLMAFEPKINWESYSCQDTARRNRIIFQEQDISCNTAKNLANAWMAVHKDSITQQLYTYQQSGSVSFDIKDRVRYYIFNHSDVEKIYQHQQLLEGQGDTCFFHLHLGKQDNVDWIPMRNILHLDNKDLKVDSVLNITKSTYFEFSRPCPKFCNDIQ